MAKRFDFVFGLGSACSCTQTLRAAGLQFASYPLDWVYGGGVRERTALVTGGFGGWMEKGDFMRLDGRKAFGHDPYVNRRTGMHFPHDFEKGIDFSVAFQSVRAKYDRRIARFETRMERSRTALVVWIADPRDAFRLEDADMRYCLDAFAHRWPKTLFRMFAVDFAAGIAPGEMSRRDGNGFKVLRFDYHDPAGEDFSVRPELLLPLFADVEAKDYRTLPEKFAAWRRRRKSRRVRLNAQSAWDAFATGLQLRLYNHLKKRLEHRGMRISPTT